MAINRSLGGLPYQQAGGWAPDRSPRFAHLLADQWHAENAERGVRPHAVEGTRFRHSDAGGCARKIAYKAAGIEPTDPMDLTGTWNTRLGEWIHDQWQAALQAQYPGVEIEVTSQVFEDGSGSMDALFDVLPPHPAKRISIELKTMGGFPFKAAIGKAGRNKPAEGPKPDHLIQGALNALAHEADELVIAYLGKETLSKAYSEVPDVSKFCAEWTLTFEQYEPIARLEIERIEGILGLLDEGELAARKVPGVPGEIIDPETSTWQLLEMGRGEHAEVEVTDTGTVWGGQFCLYCSHQTLCIATEPGRIPVEVAVELRKGMGP